jgi:hypothetical protein
MRRKLHDKEKARLRDLKSVRFDGEKARLGDLKAVNVKYKFPRIFLRNKKLPKTIFFRSPKRRSRCFPGG